MPRYHTGIGGRTADDMIRNAKRAEDAGYEGVWSAELYGSAFVPLAVVATHTTKVKLGTSIVMAFARSPVMTALTALDLDRVSDGRFLLGLGTSLKRINETRYGVEFGRPAPHIKECIQVIRMVTERIHTGERLQFEGKYYNIDIQNFQVPTPPVRDSIPIYLAAVNQGMLRTAGEVADGLLGHSIYSLKWISDVVHPNLATGFQRAGKRRQDFDFILPVNCAISSDRREARRAAAAHIAFYAMPRTYEPLFAWHGFEKPVQEIRDAYNRKDIEGVIDAVPDEMIDAFACAGTVDEVRRKVAEYQDQSGADALSIGAPGAFIPAEQAAMMREAVFQLFAK